MGKLIPDDNVIQVLEEINEKPCMKFQPGMTFALANIDMAKQIMLDIEKAYDKQNLNICGRNIELEIFQSITLALMHCIAQHTCFFQICDD